MTVMAWEVGTEYDKNAYRKIQIDGLWYLSTTPITVAHLMAARGRDSSYQFFYERHGDRPDTLLSPTDVVHLSDDEHFYAIPPCTFNAKPVVPREPELFYVIEWPQLREGDSAAWWDGTVTRPVDALQAREAFTTNIKQAVRFNDRRSAETVLRLVNDVGLGVVGLIVSEHGWMVTPACPALPALEPPSESLTRSRIEHWLRNRRLRLKADFDKQELPMGTTCDVLMALLEDLGEYALSAAPAPPDPKEPP